MAPVIGSGLAPLRAVGDWFPTAPVTLAGPAALAGLTAVPGVLAAHERAAVVDHVVVRATPATAATHAHAKRDCVSYCQLSQLWPAWYRDARHGRVLPEDVPCDCGIYGGHSSAGKKTLAPRDDAPADAGGASDAGTAGDAGTAAGAGDAGDGAAADDDGKVAPSLGDVPEAGTARDVDKPADADARATQCKAGDFDCTCRELCDEGTTGTFPIYHAGNSSGGDAWSSTTVYCVRCCAVNVTDNRELAAALEAEAAGGLSVWQLVRRLWRR